MAEMVVFGRALVLDSIADCLKDADVVLIANADPEFKTLQPADVTVALGRVPAELTATGRAVLAITSAA